MSLATLMGRPCIIVRRQLSGEEDRYGNLIPSEATDASTCEIQQQERSEAAEGSIGETLWRAFFPIDTNLQAEDAVIVDGLEYEVVGDPWNADSGSTAVHHMEADLRRVGGVENS